jgi:hypothetical protein
MFEISFFGNFSTAKMPKNFLFRKYLTAGMLISFLGIIIAENSEKLIQKWKF